MRKEDLLQLVIIGGLLYFLVSYLQKSSFIQTPANVIADFYAWLTLPPSMIVQGNVVLPNGSLVPLSLTDVRQNGANVVVAEYEGHYYQLSPSDANGNWPATLIQ